MKLSKTTLLFFSVFTLNILYSQVKFSAGPVIGYTSPTGDYSGTTIDYYNGTRYGLSGGLHFGGYFKLKLPVLNIRFSLLYASTSNSGNSEPGKGSVDIKHNMLIFGAGPEFNFNIPGSPVKPYVGVNLLFTSISGETTFLGVERVPSGTFSMSSTTRTGLGFDAGINFGIGTKYSLDFSLNYNLNNLLGKSFTGGDDRIFSYTSLNDDRDPLYPDNDLKKHFIGNSRSISTLQLNFAFLFDF